MIRDVKSVLPVVVALVAIPPVAWYIYRRLRNWRKLNSLKTDIKNFIDKRDKDVECVKRKVKKFYENAQQNSERREEIRKLSLDGLIDALQAERHSALEVLYAYWGKAVEAHEKTNCITHFILEAEKEAKELDEKYRGKEKPPLFGVPFSVKECIPVKNYLVTFGFAHYLRTRQPAAEDAYLVTILRNSGAIPFAMTNIPQSLQCYNCKNPVFGTTSNPYDQKRTSGGSSGGEGALIGASASPFGLGSDLGGSNRIPPAFCGIVGIKPTSGRMTLNGMVTEAADAMVAPALGPLAPTVEAVVRVYQTILDYNASNQTGNVDPYMAPFPFQNDLYSSEKPLKIGVYYTNGWIDPVPACKSAVDTAREALEKCGHELVEWRPPDVENPIGMAFSAVFLDNGHFLLSEMGKDIMASPENFEAFSLLSMPRCIRNFFVRMSRDPLIAKWSQHSHDNLADLRKLYVRIWNYRMEFARKWAESELDGLICPSFASPALLHGHPEKLGFLASYTLFYNMMDYVAGVVPVGKVTQEHVEETKKDYPEESETEKLLKKSNGDDSVGLPTSVQCVAPPYKDEVCLRIMKDVESNL